MLCYSERDSSKIVEGLPSPVPTCVTHTDTIVGIPSKAILTYKSFSSALHDFSDFHYVRAF